MSSLPTVSPQAHSRNDRSRVLVVDDDEDMREILSSVLAHEGYEVLIATNGRDALNMVREHAPHVVVTDALMPSMDGRELSRRIKDEWPAIRVVLMTSLYKSARHKQEALNVFGVDHFFSKPLDLEALLNAISTLTGEQP